MPIVRYESLEKWSTLVVYEIDVDLQEDGEREITEGSPTRKEFEIIGREVERIINATEVEREM